MRDFQSKIKRQIELLGLTLAYPGKYKTMDFSEIFGCEELTIKRDLKELRSYGIDIHAIKGKGVDLTTQLTEEHLKEIILQYIGMCYSESSVDKATNLFVKYLNNNSLPNLVLLQRAIDNSEIIYVDYQKDNKTIEKYKELCPLIIFQADGYYRLLATNEGIKKQFLISKIIKIYPSEKKFKKPSKNEIQELFKYSWKSWIGDEQYKVKLKFSKVWAERLKPKLLMETQNLIKNDDGSVIFEASVNSLNEIATWIAGRGEGVTVYEPKELKNMVIDIAKGVLKNYN